jgi:hypothetical protein
LLAWLASGQDTHRDSDAEPVHLAYNPSFSACFFNRNSIFLSQ